MPTIDGEDIRSIVVACEAGMGSSVLLTSQLSARLKPYGVTVSHSPVHKVRDGAADVVVCHQGLSVQARRAAPGTVVLSYMMFIGDPAFDALEAAIRDGGTLGG